MKETHITMIADTEVSMTRYILPSCLLFIIHGTDLAAYIWRFRINFIKYKSHLLYKQNQWFICYNEKLNEYFHELNSSHKLIVFVLLVANIYWIQEVMDWNGLEEELNLTERCTTLPKRITSTSLSTNLWHHLLCHGQWTLSM